MLDCLYSYRGSGIRPAFGNPLYTYAIGCCAGTPLRLGFGARYRKPCRGQRFFQGHERALSVAKDDAMAAPLRLLSASTGCARPHRSVSSRTNGSDEAFGGSSEGMTFGRRRDYLSARPTNRRYCVAGKRGRQFWSLQERRIVPSFQARIAQSTPLLQSCLVINIQLEIEI